MFRCENDRCNQVVPPHQPVNKIVTERRERTYEKKIKSGKNKGKVELVNGWEIVKEINVCPKCYRILTGKAPKIVEVEKAKTFANKPHIDNKKKKSWRNPTTKKASAKPEKKEVTEKKKPVVEVVNPVKIIKE